MQRFKEHDEVRLTKPHSGPASYGGGDVRLPVGSIGEIVDLLGRRDAYEVEFVLAEPVFGTTGEVVHAGKFVVVTIRDEQLEAAA